MLDVWGTMIMENVGHGYHQSVVIVKEPTMRRIVNVKLSFFHLLLSEM